MLILFWSFNRAVFNGLCFTQKWKSAILRGGKWKPFYFKTEFSYPPPLPTHTHTTTTIRVKQDSICSLSKTDKFGTKCSPTVTQAFWKRPNKKALQQDAYCPCFWFGDLPTFFPEFYRHTKWKVFWNQIKNRGLLVYMDLLIQTPLDPHPWTETPTPGQRPPPLDRDPPWTETPTPGQRPPPLDRDPHPWTETPTHGQRTPP